MSVYSTTSIPFLSTLFDNFSIRNEVNEGKNAKIHSSLSLSQTHTDPHPHPNTINSVYPRNLNLDSSYMKFGYPISNFIQVAYMIQQIWFMTSKAERSTILDQENN